MSESATPLRVHGASVSSYTGKIEARVVPRPGRRPGSLSLSAAA
jgi:hypothetical protein